MPGDEIAGIVYIDKDTKFFDENRPSSNYNGPGLPDYQDLKNCTMSPRNSLTLTDCHEALVKTIKKARLIIFEIARRSKRLRFVSEFGASRAIVLQDGLLQLDKTLVRFDEKLTGLMLKDNVKGIHVSQRLELVMKAQLRAREDYRTSTGKKHKLKETSA